MAGVTANESYCVDNVGDVLNEDAAGATDTVFATVGFSLTAGQSRSCGRSAPLAGCSSGATILTSKLALSASDFTIV